MNFKVIQKKYWNHLKSLLIKKLKTLSQVIFYILKSRKNPNN